jgi:hypothetical protein
MTAGGDGQATHLSELERARRALRTVEGLGELDGQERLQMAAMGSSVGHAQRSYLEYAGVLALVSIAGELEALSDSLVAIEADLGALVIHLRKHPPLDE